MPVVEVMGFEPTASSMRPKRSSQLSYTPEGSQHDSRGPGGAGNGDRATGRSASVAIEGGLQA